jgi:Kef-type K+ transport system membrane component KefB
MSGMITATILILAVFFILPFLYFLPKVSWRFVALTHPQAVLASIITLVVYGSAFISYHGYPVLVTNSSPRRGSS